MSDLSQQRTATPTRPSTRPGSRTGRLPDADHAHAPRPHLWVREGLTGLELAQSAASRRYLAGLPAL